MSAETQREHGYFTLLRAAGDDLQAFADEPRPNPVTREEMIEAARELCRDNPPPGVDTSTEEGLLVVARMFKAHAMVNWWKQVGQHRPWRRPEKRQQLIAFIEAAVEVPFDKWEDLDF